MFKTKKDKLDQFINDTKQHRYRGRRKAFPMGYYDMYALNLVGVNYRGIALATGYSYSWVKHLFARKGNVRGMIERKYDPYDKWKKEIPPNPPWLDRLLKQNREESIKTTKDEEL